MSEKQAQFQNNENTFRLVSQALVILMMTCAAVTLLNLVNRLIPVWQPWYLAGLSFFAAFERLVTYRKFRMFSLFSREWATALLAEWVVMILLAKGVVGLSHGGQAFVDELFLWLKNFVRAEPGTIPGSFFSSDFLFALAVLAATWWVSGYFAEVLDEMGLEKARKSGHFPLPASDQQIVRNNPFGQSPYLEQIPISADEKPPARERLLSLVFGTGSVLVLMTAIMRVDFRAGAGLPVFLPVPALQSGGASTLLYFMFGLALLSQTQFMDLHTTWGLQGISVSRKLAGRWTFYSSILLGIVAVITSILPTSFSLGALATIQFVFGSIFRFLFFVIQIFSTLLLFILGLVFNLFGGTPPSENPLALPQAPQVFPKTLSSVPPGNNVWVEGIKNILFWSFFIAIVIFSFRQYLRQHQEGLAYFRKLRAAGWLAKLWNWLSGLARAAQQGISRAIEVSRARSQNWKVAAGDVLGREFFNPRRLTARQKVIFYYLALIRRAGERGLARSKSQTPTEFAARLDAAMPGVEGEIDALTDAFVQARYSQVTVEKESARLVNTYWDRIKKALRARGGKVR